MTARRMLHAADLAAIEERMEKVVREKVPTILRDEMIELGLDIALPAAKLEMQKDMAFLRNARKGSERARALVRNRIIIATISGITMLLGLGFLAWVSQRFPLPPAG